MSKEVRNSNAVFSSSSFSVDVIDYEIVVVRKDWHIPGVLPTRAIKFHVSFNSLLEWKDT